MQTQGAGWTALLSPGKREEGAEDEGRQSVGELGHDFKGRVLKPSTGLFLSRSPRKKLHRS